MSWAGCQINPIDINFHLQKCLETFEKKLADKSDHKEQGDKSTPAVPNKVNPVPTRFVTWYTIAVIAYLQSG